MIVFDLKCSNSHTFEAWFGSSGDYEDQKARGLVTCPVCNDGMVVKAVMAPAVAAKGNQRSDVAPANVRHPVAQIAPEDAARLEAMIGKLAQAQAEMLAKSSWVGTAFADKARAMHYGDEPRADIHGTADMGEAQSLIEEGIAIAALPIPVVPPEERN